MIVIFQTRIGKIFAGLKYDIQSMEVRLNGNETESNSEERTEAEAV